MSLAASVKPAYVLGGLGVAATPAVGYGGWKIYEGMDSPVGREFSGKGYEWNPPTLDMEVKPIPEDVKYKIRTYNCFRNFFPGAEIKSTKTTASAGTFPTFGWGGADTSSGNPMGCALMQLDYKSNDDFVFTSEIVVKNEKIGMALWTTVTPTQTHTNGNFDHKSWAYYLLFLKKEDLLWRVVNGVFWVDSEVRNNYENAIKQATISSPENLWLKSGNPISPTTAPLKKSYSGFWETVTNEQDKKEIFQEIKVYKGDGDNTNILGKGHESDGNQDLFRSESIVATAYYQNDQWHEYGSSESSYASPSLNTMYAPFKGKKGKWTAFNGRDDCTKWRQDRVINDKDKGRLRNLCYIDRER